MERPRLLLFCALLTCTLLNARKAEYASNPSMNSGLEISCTVSQKDKPMREYRILIIENDSLFDTVYADLTMPVYIQLDLNKSYMLEFSKPGFLERLVLVDTKVPVGAVNRRFSYDFEVELPPSYSDTGFHAVRPIARIIYDTKVADFNYDEEYAKSIGNIPTLSTIPDTKEKPGGTTRRKQQTVTRKKL